jgi:hypothetical protein
VDELRHVAGIATVQVDRRKERFALIHPRSISLDALCIS